MGIPFDHPAILQARANGLIAGDTATTAPPLGGRKPKAVAKPGKRAAAAMVIEATVSATVVSEPNAGGSRRAAIARKAAVKGAVAAALPALACHLPLPCRVTLTRLGSRRLDDDNLAGAFKACRDVVAEWVGADDGDPRVRWVYRQRAAYAPGLAIRYEWKAPHGEAE